MRKYLLAAVAVAAIASPAAARDGTGYIGLEGGLMFPSDMDIDGEFLFEDPDGVDFLESDIAELEFNTGLDLDLIGGYDFGGFRLEPAEQSRDFQQRTGTGRSRHQAHGDRQGRRIVGVRVHEHGPGRRERQGDRDRRRGVRCARALDREAALPAHEALRHRDRLIVPAPGTHPQQAVPHGLKRLHRKGAKERTDRREDSLAPFPTMSSSF